MALSFNWSVVATIVADLKTLISKNFDSRLSALESAQSSGIPQSVSDRLDALEGAVNQLSEALAAYTAESPTEPPTIAP